MYALRSICERDFGWYNIPLDPAITSHPPYCMRYWGIGCLLPITTCPCSSQPPASSSMKGCESACEWAVMWICVFGVLLRERERLEWGLSRWMGGGREVFGEIKSAVKMRAVDRRRRRSMHLSGGLTQGVFPRQLREEGWHWCVGLKLDPLVVWGLENIHTPAAVLEGSPECPHLHSPLPPVTHRKNAVVLKSHEYPTPTHSSPALSFQFRFLFPSLSLRSLWRLSSFVYSSSLLSVFCTQLSGGMLSFFQPLKQPAFYQCISVPVVLAFHTVPKMFINSQSVSSPSGWNGGKLQTLWCIHTLSQQPFM